MAFLTFGFHLQSHKFAFQRTRTFTRYGLPNSVISPAFFPFTGSRRAESGLCHLTARLAISPIMPASSASEISPGSGTASSPVLQTEEYDMSESRLIAPDSQRLASTESSSTGSISPL